jgi:hypothetical protein
MNLSMLSLFTLILSLLILSMLILSRPCADADWPTFGSSRRGWIQFDFV